MALTVVVLLALSGLAAYIIRGLMEPDDAQLSGLIEAVPYPGRPDELLVVLQGGHILLVSLSEPDSADIFGDVSDLLGDRLLFEEGLLGLAFSPDFASDDAVYLNYTAGTNYALPGEGVDDPRRNVISRFLVRDVELDLDSEEVILEIPQPSFEHNGGHLAFGPDGYLYVSVGDGGPQRDPNENGQDTSTLHGAILRIDVATEDGYTIPPDNPFASGGGAPEMFAYGLRNPWRFSFDRATGDLWAGDVGHNHMEEVNLIVAGGNYGWDCFEGLAVYERDAGCDDIAAEEPRAVYTHGDGCSISGGYVYRGQRYPGLHGAYIFGDYCTGTIWSLDVSDEDADAEKLTDSGLQITSFAELPDGELLVVGQSQGVYRVGPELEHVLPDPRTLLEAAGFDVEVDGD